jgi:hypothetical protein
LPWNREAAVALARNRAAVDAVSVLFGLHTIVWVAVLASWRQELTPHRLRSRVGKVHVLPEYGTIAPGAPLGGLLASRFDLEAPVWLRTAAGAALILFTWSAYSDDRARARRHAGGGEMAYETQSSMLGLIAAAVRDSRQVPPWYGAVLAQDGPPAAVR